MSIAILYVCSSAESCRTDKIEYIRFEENSTVIKLSSYSIENYTDRGGLRDPLLCAFLYQLSVRLHTTSCEIGDHGFSDFTLSRTKI